MILMCLQLKHSHFDYALIVMKVSAENLCLTRISLQQIVHSLFERITAMEIITIIKSPYED